MGFLGSRHARVLTLVLVVQACLFYAVAARPERTPFMAPLAQFPTRMGGWETVREVPVEPEIQQVLKADDTLDRVYINPARTDAAYLFIAFFKTQRYGQAPHSPKNCLPGNGWEPISTDRPTIQVSGWPTPITVNRYVVAYADQKSVTLYWYQSHNRVVASEYWAKFWLVADALRYRRSDTAMIRIAVPVRDGDVQAASNAGVEFVQALFPELLKQMPL
jgi:EpsI family protein